MNRGVACLVVALVVSVSVAPAVAAGTPGKAFGVSQEFDPDQVSLSASLQPNGDAQWTFTYRMRLTNENETAAFQSLEDDVAANSSEYVARFRDRISSTVNAAENSTGREMAVENVTIRAFQQSFGSGEFDDSYGVVQYTFTWTGFASTDGDQIVAGDALEGFYLDDETSLRIAWPQDYARQSVDPAGDESTANSVLWRGPQDFGAGQPSVVVASGGTTGTTGNDDTAGEGLSGLLLPAVVGALVAVAVLAAVWWFYWRPQAGDGAAGPGPTGGRGGGGGAAAAADGEAAAPPASEPEGEETQPPEELLSNEERVKRFLREQGGRAKQQDVVGEMGWTEAKTSQVVKQMRENDELESFRIGRENVLKLTDGEDDDELA